MSEEAARKRWEIENNVAEESDDIYRYDESAMEKFREAAPWKNDVHYFKKMKISGIALLKMVLHARQGLSQVPGQDPDFEVMGLMLGKVQGDTIIVMDSFAVCQGNEVRVNAGVADYEFMVQYTEGLKMVGKNEGVVGWYHSHPGYGCWLSGIDVNTQTENQKYQDPWAAVVIDPKQTMSSGRVEIGAFRCYPPDYTPSDSKDSEWQYIPRERIEEFGVHAKMFYKMDIQVFKSNLDSKLFNLLWNKYWVKTLSSSPNLSNRDFTTKKIEDLAGKLEKAEKDVGASRSMGMLAVPSKKKKDESELAKFTRDSSNLTVSQLNGVINQVIKHALFNMDHKH